MQQLPSIWKQGFKQKCKILGRDYYILAFLEFQCLAQFVEVKGGGFRGAQGHRAQSYKAQAPIVWGAGSLPALF